MFSEYFAKKSKELQYTLKQKIDARGAHIPGKEKDVRIYKELYDFLRDHVPTQYAMAMGKVRNKKHVLNRNCDLLIYNKWCKKFLEMSGGYVPIDSLYSFLTIETDLTTEMLLNHASHTEAVKALFASDGSYGTEEIVPVFSVLVSYKSSLPLVSHQKAIEDVSRERNISLNHETDMVCILGQGLIVKDWESGGNYRVIETGDDTLMWFYVLLLEYLDRDGKLGFDPRKYMTETKTYNEY